MESNNILSFLAKNWVILAFIGGLIVGWTQVNTTIKNNERRIAMLETRVENTATLLAGLQQDIVEIKTTLLFIKEQLQKP